MKILNLRKIALLALAAIWVIGATSAGAATVLSTDGSWYRFGFEEVGSHVSARAADGGLLASDGDPFTFLLDHPGILTIVDLQLSVDQFQVIINGTDMGTTSTPIEGSSVGLDVATALADLNFSRGYYNLGPGAYSVDIILYDGKYLPGSGAVSVRPVPEPGILLLLGSGLVGLIGFRRKFKK